MLASIVLSRVSERHARASRRTGDRQQHALHLRSKLAPLGFFLSETEDPVEQRSNISRCKKLIELAIMLPYTVVRLQNTDSQTRE